MPRKISRRKFILGGAAALTVAALVDAFWLEQYFFAERHFSLDIAGRENEPKLKIVQLSDLHLTHVGRVHHAIAEAISKYEPHVIFLTGDTIDQAKNLPLVSDFMNMLPASIPKIAITGNWEYWGMVDLSQLRDAYEWHNCRLLINEHASLTVPGDKKLVVTGIDDLVGGNANYTKAVANKPASDLHIVLNHCPAYRDKIAALATEPIDLILSGHTHGGQIAFLGWIPFLPQGTGGYAKGWFRENGPPTYVSTGIGTSVIPIRFGARSEIVFMEL